MAKRAKKIPQKEKLLEIAPVDVRKKDRRKIVKEILPNPFPFCVYGSPCRAEDMFSISIGEIIYSWERSELYRISKNTRIINAKTFFWEFIASELNAESVPGVSSGKIGLLYETVTKTLIENAKEKQDTSEKSKRRKAKA